MSCLGSRLLWFLTAALFPVPGGRAQISFDSHLIYFRPDFYLATDESGATQADLTLAINEDSVVDGTYTSRRNYTRELQQEDSRASLLGNYESSIAADSEMLFFRFDFSDSITGATHPDSGFSTMLTVSEVLFFSSLTDFRLQLQMSTSTDRTEDYGIQTMFQIEGTSNNTDTTLHNLIQNDFAAIYPAGNYMISVVAVSEDFTYGYSLELSHTDSVQGQVRITAVPETNPFALLAIGLVLVSVRGFRKFPGRRLIRRLCDLQLDEARGALIAAVVVEAPPSVVVVSNS